MREMRKIKRKLSEEESYSLLEDLKTITISMYDEEFKTPYAVIMNPIVNGSTIFVHCANEGRKIDILKKNGNVCITAVSDSKIIEDKFTTAYKSIVITSCARFVEEKEDKIKVLELLCEKLTPSNSQDAITRLIAAQIDNTTIIAFDIESISGKCYLKEKLKD
jgi:nitroimidazol reductase NimA-like FMN-containing flavoprotein (pyridoxamine 5'-phosphate oxidase superfamily)